MLLEEVSEAFLEQVHLGIEDQARSRHVIDPPVQLSESLPEFGTSLLTVLAMEHDDGPFLHPVADLLHVTEESLSEQMLIVDIDGALDVTERILVIKATINNHDWMVSVMKKICQCVRADRILFRTESLIKLQLWQELSFISLLEKLVLNHDLWIADRVDLRSSQRFCWPKRLVFSRSISSLLRTIQNLDLKLAACLAAALH